MKELYRNVPYSVVKNGLTRRSFRKPKSSINLLFDIFVVQETLFKILVKYIDR